MSANRKVRMSAPETSGGGAPDLVSSATIRRVYDPRRAGAVPKSEPDALAPVLPSMPAREVGAAAVPDGVPKRPPRGRADTFAASARAHPPNASNPQGESR